MNIYFILTNWEIKKNKLRTINHSTIPTIAYNNHAPNTIFRGYVLFKPHMRQLLSYLFYS